MIQLWRQIQDVQIVWNIHEITPSFRSPEGSILGIQNLLQPLLQLDFPELNDFLVAPNRFRWQGIQLTKFRQFFGKNDKLGESFLENKFFDGTGHLDYKCVVASYKSGIRNYYRIYRFHFGLNKKVTPSLLVLSKNEQNRSNCIWNASLGICYCSTLTNRKVL